MLIQTTDGRTFSIHFHHFTKTPSKSNKRSRGTSCAIHEGPCEQKARPCGTANTVTATTECSVKDNFERATGRKVAFSRALQGFTEDKNLRKELWTAYQNYKPVQKAAQNQTAQA